MSRIGRRRVAIPSGVTVTEREGTVEVKGPKGTLRERLPARTRLTIEASEVRVQREDDAKPTRALHGLTRALLANMVTGVTVAGKSLNLSLGFSHPVVLPIPEGLKVSVQENRIRIEGPDRGQVGQFASDVRELRPPEPYKGKGIRYANERVRRKVGKAGA